MAIWAIADLHLSFGILNKKMDIFGLHWEDHAEKIAQAWRELVSVDDLVLIPGDISWALRLEEVKPDLEWIGQLPGTKVLLKGNHDFWWGSLAKVKTILPPSCHLIQNNHFLWKGICIAGARLWDTSEFNFQALSSVERDSQLNEEVIEESEMQKDLGEQEKVFQREIGRLETSLRSMPSQAHIRIVMTHYPPIGLELKDSQVSRLLEKYRVQICVFGHLHNIKPGTPLFGRHQNIDYHLTACDYLDFKPLKIYE